LPWIEVIEWVGLGMMFVKGYKISITYEKKDEEIYNVLTITTNTFPS
jgi:hypothetical protein